MKELFKLYKCLNRAFYNKNLSSDNRFKRNYTRLVFDRESNTLLPVSRKDTTQSSEMIITMKTLQTDRKLNLFEVKVLREMAEDIKINPNRIPFLRDNYYRTDWREDWTAEQHQHVEGFGQTYVPIVELFKSADADTSFNTIAEAFNEITFSDLESDLLIPYLEDMQALGMFNEVRLPKYTPDIVKSKLYGKLKQAIWVPMYIKADYIAETAYKGAIETFVTAFKLWFDGQKDNFTLAQELMMERGTIQPTTGREIRTIRDWIQGTLRPYVSDQLMAEDGLSSVSLEALDIIINEALTDIIEAEAVYITISDSMKLNPITNEEYMEHVFLNGFDYIVWKKYEPVTEEALKQYNEWRETVDIDLATKADKVKANKDIIKDKVEKLDSKIDDKKLWGLLV